MGQGLTCRKWQRWLVKKKSMRVAGRAVLSFTFFFFGFFFLILKSFLKKMDLIWYDLSRSLRSGRELEFLTCLNKWAHALAKGSLHIFWLAFLVLGEERTVFLHGKEIWGPLFIAFAGHIVLASAVLATKMCAKRAAFVYQNLYFLKIIREHILF